MEPMVPLVLRIEDHTSLVLKIDSTVLITKATTTRTLSPTSALLGGDRGPGLYRA